MKFWVDMDNAPHVHVLAPIIKELRRRGHVVEITARDYGQTLPLLRMYGLEYRQFGCHAGKNKLKKHLSFVTRSLSLLFYARKRAFDAAFCHGSRANLPAVKLLRIPLVALADYEFAALPRFMVGWTRLLLIPDVIPRDVFVRRGIPIDRIQGYPGLKEDLYVHEFQPDPTFLHGMGINQENILVLVRPPATMAHYAVKASGVLFYKILDELCRHHDVQILLLPRTSEQGLEIETYINKCGYRNAIIPDEVLNGPNLIWYSDLVISGGGTMNREAASLGVPVVSIYQGPIGAVDRHLMETGKLAHVSTIAEFNKICLRKSCRKTTVREQNVGARVCCHIADRILQVATGSNQPSALSGNGTA